MTHEEHIQAVRGYTVEHGFMEKEIGREVISYGTITHVFSTYEILAAPDAPEPAARGINSLQLFWDDVTDRVVERMGRFGGGAA